MAENSADVLIVDGYVDEPGLLGVPPYIAPEIRKLAGVCRLNDLKFQYFTADEAREQDLPETDLTLLYGGVTVPGNYLGGQPLSPEEAKKICRRRPETLLGGPLAANSHLQNHPLKTKGDLAAYFSDYLKKEEQKDREPQPEELQRWLVAGAPVAAEHPDHPDTVLAEISLYHGCVRYFSGGCRFCSEPAYGRPRFRRTEDVIAEVQALYRKGVRHFRLGGQSCIISYGTEGLGETETPRPNPKKIEELLAGINRTCPEIKVLHVDNANPAVMAAHPRPSKEILQLLVGGTTAGNILALGLESADPAVIRQNNLNSTPEETKKAVAMINRAGRERGENGMPRLLPGINFLAGLKGETDQTFRLNLEFLQELLAAGHWLRRINIRQVLSHREDFTTVNRRKFKEFKKEVREKIDRPLLKKMFPPGTVLKDVYMEKKEGRNSFGRQVGTYPLLVGVNYELELDTFYDIKVTDHGYRSITGVENPLKFSDASVKQLEAIPGIGSKRARKLFLQQPKNAEDLEDIINDPEVVQTARNYLSFTQ